MISIIIPVHKTETKDYLNRTLDGIVKTIGIDPWNYSITLVGTLPPGFFVGDQTAIKWNFVPTTSLLGDAKNEGAQYALGHFDPDILVFMDAHMNFFLKESKNWGLIIEKYLTRSSGVVISPSISIYDNPSQRGLGVITDMQNFSTTADLAWRWVGTPNSAGPNSPIEVPGLCGCFMAMTPATFKKSIIGFTPPLAIDDREFSLRIWTLGVNLYSLPEITVGHRFASGYSDFTKQRSISWGSGMLLYAFLNMGDDAVRQVFEKGIGASQDKAESLKISTSPHWKQVRQELQQKRVRTYDDYYQKFRYLLR